MSRIPNRLLIAKSRRFAESVAKGQSITKDMRHDAVDLFLQLNDHVAVPDQFNFLDIDTFVRLDELFYDRRVLIAIKLIREETGYGLGEAKDLAKRIANHFGYEDLPLLGKIKILTDA